MFGRTHSVQKTRTNEWERWNEMERVIVNTHLSEMKKKVNKKNWLKMRTVLQSLGCLLPVCWCYVYRFSLPSRISPSIPKMTWNMCGNSILCEAFFIINLYIFGFLSELSADWDYWHGIWMLKVDLLCSLMITQFKTREMLLQCSWLVY